MTTPPVEPDIQKYRNLTITFINQHKKDLVSIFLQHSRESSDEDRVGVLGINLLDFDETSKIDVAYLPVRILGDTTRERVIERIKENDIHVIYFLMLSPLEEQIIELDIRELT
jgi:hypothetical protein